MGELMHELPLELEICLVLEIKNNCMRKWTNKRGYMKTIRQLIKQNDGWKGLSNIAKKNGKLETTPTIGNGQGKTSLITEEGDGLLKNPWKCGP